MQINVPVDLVRKVLVDLIDKYQYEWETADIKYTQFLADLAKHPTKRFFWQESIDSDYEKAVLLSDKNRRFKIFSELFDLQKNLKNLSTDITVSIDSSANDKISFLIIQKLNENPNKST